MGILSGFLAAICCSIGYFLNARFLKRYPETGRQVTYAFVSMMLLSLPVFLVLFPFQALLNPGIFIVKLIAWVAVFIIGQGSFFMALNYYEASRLSSLLGLKIIVLALIFILYYHGVLCGMQWLAILLSALAAMMFNWSGARKQNNIGWIFVLLTLIGYSSADIIETDMVLQVKRSGFSDLRSAFSVVSVLYPALGVAVLPGMLKYKPTREQFVLAMPYAAVWIASQMALLVCYAKLLPVYGNVILAMRGVFAVFIGACLSSLGVGNLEPPVPRRKWIQRTIGALVMLLAIALYSWGAKR